MRVLHVCPTYYPATAFGGPIVSTHALLRAQMSLGISVRALTTDWNGRSRLPSGDREVDGVSVQYARAIPLNRYGVSPGLFWAIAREARSSDVLHLHGTSLPSTTVGLWIATAVRRPVVVSPHGSLMAWALASKHFKKSAYSVLDRWLLRRATIHATSLMEAYDARSLGIERIVVVQNGVDACELQVPVGIDIRTRLHLPPDARIIAWLGRFDPVKNLEPLLDATRGQGWTVVLAGDHDTTYGRALRDRTLRERRNDVRFIGPVGGELKSALLQQANVYVHTSHMESYGMAIAEALAAGCPVVASTGTPWREIEAGDAGFWIAPDPSGIRSAIEALLARDRDALRTSARAIAARHNWTERARAFLCEYETLISGGRRVPRSAVER